MTRAQSDPLSAIFQCGGLMVIVRCIKVLAGVGRGTARWGMQMARKNLPAFSLRSLSTSRTRCCTWHTISGRQWKGSIASWSRWRDGPSTRQTLESIHPTSRPAHRRAALQLEVTSSGRGNNLAWITTVFRRDGRDGNHVNHHPTHKEQR